MLRHRADLQTLLYMLITTALPLVQWQLESFHPLLFLASSIMAFAVGAMHHNHAHVPIWHSRHLNTATDYWFTLFQGHPGYAFRPAHINNHHRHRNRERDCTRTYRLRDDNSLLGFFLHPFESAFVLVPVLTAYLGRLRCDRPAEFRSACMHYGFLVACVGLALALDPRKAVLYLLLPQALALFFLLASNYLQHAHTDEMSPCGHSRNFVGLINLLFFNVGYHTVHHRHSRLHWSRLPVAHARLAGRIDPRLIERSFVWYFLRVYVLALFVPGLRSQSLRGRARAA